jgi:hypothetical protein
MLDRVRVWLGQTSTRTGLLSVLTGATAYLLGGMDAGAAASTVLVGIVGLVLPDNQAGRAAATALARDGLALVAAAQQAGPAPTVVVVQAPSPLPAAAVPAAGKTGGA